MIDNFEQIKGLLVFDSEDEFYHLQIIKRKKENPEIGSNSAVIKTYYIRSTEYLDTKRSEIKALCKNQNARACINLNRRSFEKMAFHTLRKVADQIMNKDFKSVRKAYESVCGKYSAEKEKMWIMDVDDKNRRYVNEVMVMAESCEPKGLKFKSLIETKNGFHIIMSPFNVKEFNECFKDFYSDKEIVDIHKDNPTILYHE